MKSSIKDQIWHFLSRVVYVMIRMDWSSWLFYFVWFYFLYRLYLSFNRLSARKLFWRGAIMAWIFGNSPFHPVEFYRAKNDLIEFLWELFKWWRGF